VDGREHDVSEHWFCDQSLPLHDSLRRSEHLIECGMLADVSGQHSLATLMRVRASAIAEEWHYPQEFRDAIVEQAEIRVRGVPA
jgi:hypothetical protein